jgi:hypothetical protein
VTPAPVDADVVAQRLADVRRRIVASGGDARRVTVVAVTKTFGSDAVLAALGAGLADIGENYAQELIEKAAAVVQARPAAPPRWHFIGAVQRNKVRGLAPVVDVWGAIGRRDAGRAVARVAPGARVLVQVNATGEPAKSGYAPSETAREVAALREVGLDVVGLMTIGRAGPPEQSRPAFATVSALADELGLSERSMGMSADLEVAIEEGSTMVRIGSALFGARRSAGARGERSTPSPE